MEKKKNNIIGVLLSFLIVVGLGLFIYPKISHQKGGEDPNPPGEPQNLNASVDADSIVLSWDLPRSDGGGEINYYIVRYIQGRDEPIDQNVGNVLSYKLSNMENNSYNLFVAAVNNTGVGDFAGPVSLDVNYEPVDISAPSEFIMSAGDGSVTLDWTNPVGDFRLNEYFIGYKIASDSDYSFISTNDKPYTFENLTNDTEYLFIVYLDTNLGPSATSEPQSVTPTSSPELDFSNEPSVQTNMTSAIITWGTTRSASSQVFYGPAENLSRSTDVFNSTPMVKGHVVTLENLNPCTVYIYKVVSYDSSDNFVESSSGEFTTQCRAGANILSFNITKVVPSSSASVGVQASGRDIQAVIPVGAVPDRDIAVQAIKIDRNSIVADIGKPTNRVWVGESFVLNAIDGAGNYIQSFNQNVTVSINYKNDDLDGVDPDSLKIWHHDDSAGWRQLQSCSINKSSGGGTVTCQTNSFSIFGLFGSEVEGDGGGQGGGNQSPDNTTQPSSTSGSIMTGSLPISSNQLAVVQENKDISENKKYNFLVDLWLGVRHPDVIRLQNFLNLNGFIVSNEGHGSPGSETDFFGPKTKNALILFQEQNKIHILTPIGLNFGTGFFGPMTRGFINLNLGQ